MPWETGKLAQEMCWGLAAGGIQRSSEITEEAELASFHFPKPFSALGFYSHSGEGSLGLAVEGRKGTVGSSVILRMGCHCPGAIQDKALLFKDLGLGTGERHSQGGVAAAGACMKILDGTVRAGALC